MVNITSNRLSGQAILSSQQAEAKSNQAMEKLTSGARVTSAANDAAGLAVARKMQSQIRSLEAGLKNNSTAVSAIDTALSGISSLQDMTLRIQELAVQASNGVYTDADRVLLDQEAQSLRDEYMRVAQYSTINDVYLLDGSFDTSFLVGSGLDEQVDVAISGVINMLDLPETSQASGTAEEVIRAQTTASGTSAFQTPGLARAEAEEEGKQASGTSAFDIPATQTASVSTSFDFLDEVAATGTSLFDTPASSAASGSSAISILPTNSATLLSSNFVGTGNTITGTSTLSVLPASTASLTSNMNNLTNNTATATSNAASSIPATSTADVAAGGASSFNALSFDNGNFSSADSSGSGPLSGSSTQIDGWDIGLSQISLDAGGVNTTIAGWPTPADAIQPAGTSGDGTTLTSAVPGVPNPTVFSYADQGNSLILETQVVKTAGNGIAHGPYVVSQDAVGLNAGDEVSFTWEGLGGEQIDVFAYLLNVDDGSTVTLLDFTDTDGGVVAPQTINSGPLATTGRYKFVFISGSHDIDGGGSVAAEVALSNVSITKNSAGPSITSTADVTIEAEESDQVTITLDKLASLETIVTDATISPLNATPYSLSGTDAASFSINQATGEITSNPLRNATKSTYNFTVTYLRADGGYHKENVTLNLKPSLGATSSLTAQEATNLRVNRSSLTLLSSYISSNGGGTYNLSGADAALFSLVPGGNGDFVSAAPIDYDDRVPPVYNLTLEYTQGGVTFNNDITLTLTDTLTSTANATAEEAQQVTLNIADFTGSQTYASKPANAGGNFTLSGTDAGKFQFDAFGNIVSNQPLLLANQDTYRFNLNYNGASGVHVESVTLRLTEALQADSALFVNHAVTASIDFSLLTRISAFAASGAGTWRLESNATDPNDFLEFTLDQAAGTITSNALTDYNTEDRFDFDVVFERTSDSAEFRETVTLYVRDPGTVFTEIEAEETDLLTIDLAQLPGSSDAKTSNPAGTFSLSGADAALFSIDPVTGQITSNGLMNLTGSRTYNLTETYNFNVDYTVGAVLFRTEDVTLRITEALQSTSNLTAAESGSVTISRNTFERLNEFAARDRYRGVYSFDFTQGDYARFSIDPSGNISSRTNLEFNERANHTYNFDLLYTDSNNNVFRDSVTLLLTDTFTSTAAFTVEEADYLTISINELTSSQRFQTNYAGGSFSLGGADAGFFQVDSQTGDINSVMGQTILRSVRDPYVFDLIYTGPGGDVHTEAITIDVTESLHSDAQITSPESGLITILMDDFAYLKAFALRDGNNGTYRITGDDAGLFQLSALGNVESIDPIYYGDRADNTYRFNVEYTQTLAAGGNTFAAEVVFEVGETYSSTAVLSVIEGSDISIDLEDLTASKTYSERHAGGSFSLSGADAANFSVDPVTGNITSAGGMRLFRSAQATHQFNLVYLDPDGNTHTEAITLNLDPLPATAYARITAHEAGSVELYISDLSVLGDFVALKAGAGSYSLTGDDAALFQIVDNEKVINIGPVDYNDRRDIGYRLGVTFTANDLTSFTENLNFKLTDTLVSEASLRAEEAETVVIDLATLASSAEFASLNVGSFSLAGTDADLFTFDATRNQIISKQEQVLRGIKPQYEFDLLYNTTNNRVHSEHITLDLEKTSTLISNSTFTAIESQQVIMDDIQSSFLRQFAQTDGFAGQFSLREKQPGENRLAFSIDDTGVISTDTERPIDFEKDQTQFELVVEYLHSDGVQKYVDNLTIDVTNNAIDDYDIDLAKIDLTTRQGANDSTQIVDNILKRLSLIQSDLGATKNRLFYNMNYQLHKSLNTQMANGRIMDADIAVEMSTLLKQQLLQKAAYSMLNLITQAKLKQANILIPY